MLELDPAVILGAHQSTMADVRLTYSGNASDIIAGAVSMSSAGDSVMGARLVEPSASDGQQLMSPFFKVDARTPGMVQISNLGSTNVRAGVRMKLANSTAPPITTELINVAAGGTATLDIQPYIEQTADGLTAEGCIEVVHNGAPGTVSCSFVSMTPDPIETPMQPAPPMCQLTTFPSDLDMQPGDTVQVFVLTCGGGAVTWSADTGTITPQPSPDPGVEAATFTLPDDDSEPDTAVIQVASPGGGGTIGVEIQKAKLTSIVTMDPAGADTGGRMNPDGGTKFTLTSRKDFPAVPLQVKFKQGGLSVVADVPVDSASRPNSTTLVGTAPPNTQFIGDAAILVLADNGATKVSKKTLCDDSGCSAYYSFNPPTPATSISVPGFDRRGGVLTITAVGGGYRQFQPSDPNLLPINPNVNVAEIDFAVNTVNQGTPSSITGNVLRAGADITSCPVEGVSPCKRISVKNPGGRAQDKVKSAVALYNLLGGPPPTPLTVDGNFGNSIGGKEVTITGDDLDFVSLITLNGHAMTITAQRRHLIEATAPPNCPGSFPFLIRDVDRGSTSFAAFTYNNTLKGAALDGIDIGVALGDVAVSQVAFMTVGPCETLDVTPTEIQSGCLIVSVMLRETSRDNGSAQYSVIATADARGCNVITQQGDYRARFTLRNGSPNTTITRDLVVRVNVH